jgi:hypothetical protein
MHPREMVVASYLVPEVLKGGSAVWILGPRSVGNDLRLEHETALLDLAAGQIFLREQMNFEYCILQGTSGGGPLAAFYCQQAALPTDQRIKFSPGGRPTGLDQAELPLVDGVIFVSAHLGQGRLMMNVIDPAVIDESDPPTAGELKLLSGISETVSRRATCPCGADRRGCKGDGGAQGRGASARQEQGDPR